MNELKWPKITADTPIEEVKRIHQEIWDYVIDHGEKPETPYLAECVACAYDGLYKHDCKKCPIIWSKDNFGWPTCNRLYTQWIHATGEEKTELARQIRDLPWKFEVEENTPL